MLLLALAGCGGGDTSGGASLGGPVVGGPIVGSPIVGSPMDVAVECGTDELGRADLAPLARRVYVDARSTTAETPAAPRRPPPAPGYSAALSRAARPGAAACWCATGCIP